MDINLYSSKAAIANCFFEIRRPEPAYRQAGCDLHNEYSFKHYSPGAVYVGPDASGSACLPTACAPIIIGAIAVAQAPRVGGAIRCKSVDPQPARYWLYASILHADLRTVDKKR